MWNRLNSYDPFCLGNRRKAVLSFWDSLIISAASHPKAEEILSEDLNHGQGIEGVFLKILSCNLFISFLEFL